MAEGRHPWGHKSCPSITNVKYPIENSAPALRLGARLRAKRTRKERKMAKLSVSCPICGRNLEPIGDVIKNPRNPDKVCCPVCKKVWFPHELYGPAGSLFKRDMRTAEDGEEVPW